MACVARLCCLWPRPYAYAALMLMVAPDRPSMLPVLRLAALRYAIVAPGSRLASEGALGLALALALYHGAALVVELAAARHAELQLGAMPPEVEAHRHKR